MSAGPAHATWHLHRCGNAQARRGGQGAVVTKCRGGHAGVHPTEAAVPPRGGSRPGPSRPTGAPRGAGRSQPRSPRGVSRGLAGGGGGGGCVPAGRGGAAGPGRGAGGQKGPSGRITAESGGRGEPPLLTLPCARDAAGTAGPGERRGPGGTRAAPFRGGSGGNPAALSGQTQAALPGRCGVPRAAGGAGTRRLTCSPAPRRAPGRSRAAPPHLRPREAGSMPCNKRGGRVWTLCPRAGKRPAPAAQPRQGPASLRRMLRAPVRFVLTYGVLSK